MKRFNLTLSDAHPEALPKIFHCDTSGPLEFHPLANIFPMLSDVELKDLAEDIRQHGLKAKITLYEGKILDGRNRYLACQKVGIPIGEACEYSGDSPASFVISMNLNRRHLTSTQKVTCSVEALPFLEEEARKRQATSTGGKQPQLTQKIAEADRGEARQQAAEMFHTNREYVSAGKKIKETAPELFEAMKRGEKTISQVKREIKKAEVTQKIATLPTDKYRVIYADPPWSYNDKCDDGSVQAGGCGRHYPSMTIPDLCAMDIKSIVEPNAVLFLWVTSPLLDECWPIIKAWGFEYKSSFVWDKIKHNMGHYNSVRHELLLVCTRGSCTPDKPEQVDSVQSIERQAHSQKPEEFRAIIDRLYPHGKRIELFARKQTKGWEIYGNQVQDSASIIVLSE